MFLRSASLLTTGCFSFPDLRNASTLPGSPLYFAALFLNEGPSLSEETEWHFRQPAFFTAASPAAASWACAPIGKASAAVTAKTMICFIVPPSFLLLDNKPGRAGIGLKSYGRRRPATDNATHDRPCGAACPGTSAGLVAGAASLVIHHFP